MPLQGESLDRSYHQTEVGSFARAARKAEGVRFNDSLPTVVENLHRTTRQGGPVALNQSSSEAGYGQESPTGKMIRMKNAKLRNQIKTKEHLKDNPNQMLYTLDDKQGYVVDKAQGAHIDDITIETIRRQVQEKVESQVMEQLAQSFNLHLNLDDGNIREFGKTRVAREFGDN